MSGESAGRRRAARALLLVSGIAAGLLLAELSLRLGRACRDRLRGAPVGFGQVRDPTLGTRLVPGSHGTDAWGFNNDAVPERAAVVALGDSQTWGWAVPREQAWPRVLARRSGRAVYNMGLGKHGPLQYRELLPRALTLKPRVVVVGLYLGNDLRDAYNHVYCTDRFAARRRPDVPACDGKDPHDQAHVRREAEFVRRYRETHAAAWRFWLGEHSELVGFFARRGLWPASSLGIWEVGAAWAEADPRSAAAVDRGGVRTILTSGLNLLCLDLDDPRIAEGLRLTEDVLGEIAARAAEHGSEVLVLLIPTKTSSHADAVAGAPAAVLRVVAQETRVRERLKELLRLRGIAAVDALPALAAAVARGEAIAPASTDNHYAERGNAILAETALTGLKDLETRTGAAGP